jgi:hypothetical protein
VPLTISSVNRCRPWHWKVSRLPRLQQMKQLHALFSGKRAIAWNAFDKVWQLVSSLTIEQFKVFIRNLLHWKVIIHCEVDWATYSSPIT